MENKIIISGPCASGKSTIAKVIAATHERYIYTSYDRLVSDLEIGIPQDFLYKHSVIIIEECNTENILDLAPKFSMPLVFVTRDDVKSEDENFSDFNVINTFCKQ